MANFSHHFRKRPQRPQPFARPSPARLNDGVNAMIQVIAFDADDTLWHNESLFLDTQEKFRQLLMDYHPIESIDRKLYETEVRNLKHFGYGVKGFALSMIETAIELSEGGIPGHKLQEIIHYARQMLDAPVEVLEGVCPTVEALAKTHTLMVVTKGDLFDQETKLARSGLGDFFEHVEVVSEKSEGVYRKLLAQHEIAPANFLMVGNSLKSDVLPVLACGARAVHIPYHTTWAHEQVGERDLWAQGYHELDRIDGLPTLVEQLNGEAAP